MGPLSRIWLVALVLAGVAAAAALLLARGNDSAAVAPRAPVKVQATLDREIVEFGDAVEIGLRRDEFQPRRNVPELRRTTCRRALAPIICNPL